MAQNQNIETKRPSKKLDSIRIRPFKVERKINKQACRLTLLASMKVYPTFHVSLLDPYKANTIPGLTQLPPPPVSTDDSEIYEVEDILDICRRYHRLQYLVCWKDYQAEDNMWVDTSEVSSRNLVCGFHCKYPLKPA